MERMKLSEILPLGVILPLLIILIIELFLSYGLDFYNNRQISIIEEKKNYLTKKENEIINKLRNNEGYFIFSQYANIAKLASGRHSLNFIIDRFNSLMPKFLIIESFSYDDETKSIDLKLKTKNWEDYLKLISYLKNNEYFSIEKASDPKLEDKDQKIGFQLTLKLKNKFFSK